MQPLQAVRESASVAYGYGKQGEVRIWAQFWQQTWSPGSSKHCLATDLQNVLPSVVSHVNKSDQWCGLSTDGGGGVGSNKSKGSEGSCNVVESIINEKVLRHKGPNAP